MSGKIQRGLALAAGSSLAIGLGFVCLRPDKRRQNTTPASEPSSDGILLLEPILDRLERIEARLSAVESRPAPLASSISLTELDLRIQEQKKDIETLQGRMTETRQRFAAEAALIERRFAEVTRREDPAVLESMLDTTLNLRVEDLRVRLQAEMLESVEIAVTKFERTIDNKISSRISAIEKTLTDQSAMMTALSRRETESDARLQRLISAVENLCERSSARLPVPAPAKLPSFHDLPFESRLSQ